MKLKRIASEVMLDKLTDLFLSVIPPAQLLQNYLSVLCVVFMVEVIARAPIQDLNAASNTVEAKIRTGNKYGNAN